MHSLSMDRLHLPRLTHNSFIQPASQAFPMTQVNNSFIEYPDQCNKSGSIKSKVQTRRKLAEEEQSRILGMLADFERVKETGEMSGEEEGKENRDGGWAVDEGSCDDRQPKEIVGPKAVSNYYKHYKKLKNIIEQNKLNSTPNSPYTAILHKSESIKAFPGCYGMIKSDGERNILKLGNYRLGDKYSQVVSAGMKELKELDEYIFSRNRLTDKGFGQLLSTINAEVVKLDFSNNKIHSVDVHLMKILSSKESKLEYLNLENNKLGDAAMSNLSLALSLNKTLRYLNLNKNFLTKISGQNIACIIQKSKSLQQLYLNWNKLNGPAAKLILNKLQKNNSIVVFDYSYNLLGQNAGISDYLGSFLRLNSTVMHLDLSFNNFSYQQSQQISQHIRHNHTIFGLHFSGNFGYVNHEGFIIMDEQKESNTYDTVRANRVNGFQLNFRRPFAKYDYHLQKDVCWICEGWSEGCLEQVIPGVGKDDKFRVHYSFNGFTGKQEIMKDGHVKIVAMFPPTEVRFYYSLNGETRVFSGIATEPVNNETASLCPNLNNIHQVNILKFTAKKLIYEQNHFEVKATCLPRSAHKLPTKRKTWCYQDSVWAREWKIQDAELTKKCFERDWGHSKISNLVKNPQDQEKTKAILHENYKNIKEIYRHFAAWSPFGDVWAISLNPFTEFCNQAKMVCKQLPSKIIDLTFITTNSMSGADWKGNHQVPQRGFVRFQFMQALVRLADEKYRKNGLFETMSESIAALIQEHLKPLSSKFRSQQWRHTIYFTQQNDMLVKKFRPVFKQLYKRNSKLKVKPGDKPFMCLDEFKNICQAVGMFVSGTVVQRDSFVNFNTAMMTQVDQVENQRIYRMIEIEFIEALARMSQNLPMALFPVPQDRPKGPTLHYHFQELIYDLIHKLGSEDLKSQFPIPATSMFDIKQEFN